MFIRTKLSRERIGLEKNFQCAKLSPIVHFHIPINDFPLIRTMVQKYAFIFFLRECAPLSPTACLYTAVVKKESRGRIQSVVSFGARVISGRRKRDHISDVTRELKWLPVSDLYSFHALCLLKRLLQNGEPRSLARKLVRRGEVRQPRTRQENKLDLPKIRTEYGRRRIFYRTVDAFNRLPAQICRESHRRVSTSAAAASPGCGLM